MLTFRKGTGGAPTAAAAMAEHLREQTLSAGMAAMAEYYLRGVTPTVEGTAAVPRQDMSFGVAAYSVVRDTEKEAQRELARITDVKQSAAGYDNYQQWLAGTKLDQHVSLEDYSVSNRGLRSGLVGTPGQIAERIAEFESVGVDLLLLQCSPQFEEMERFAANIIPTIDP